MLTNKLKEPRKQLDGSGYFPGICDYNVKRYYYVTIQAAIWRMSYLAIARGKCNKPDQTKNYGTTRVKLNHRQ